MTTKQIVASGAFDDMRSRDLRFLEEASMLGELTVLLWPDDVAQRNLGNAPKFPLAERYYFMSAVRYVSRVFVVENLRNPDALPGDLRADIWADYGISANSTREHFCREKKMSYQNFSDDELKVFPMPAPASSAPGRKKVIVTGSFDWFHSGHVRFLEEASTMGDLFVVVGHDANIRLLKGAGHPLLPQEERCYAVGSIKYVKQALISTGNGWLDADPEVQRLKPDIYAVNEDGDKGGKREYCRERGIEYLLLKRVPAPGLPPRSSTVLRGF
ncbi:MAG TPA: adenylyltransferase/cytidyltransferase family protein [Verrucomicrobiae bacterium]|jgi:cytidyltransferase-like protein|nr:adenylyltransferase/cytidyltransferase family protein [Verrucomicrobiae bacterium]